ncbi:hypothetical protein A9267_13520 [Shewanella sp. UCD-FRSSP16_17]|uniref:outer membrane beta-barrel protein n=1 Tax=Shewanella TaxID=22 RepID=UPI0007EEC80D|nr:MULTISPECIES: outer membrane beta-barrel protein [Shewanella]MBQ4890586.1 porin family protein [Shewanella sp. MMG014]OBT06901.1 hypothetical protein A9267_13520 [Shewanella sp. UCD-FRSSP16_17]
MKTKQLILAGVITSMMSVPAMASDWFIGGAAGYQQNKYEDSTVGGGKEKEKDMAYQLRVGTYINDNSRVYGTYGYNSEDIGKQQNFLLSYDYLVPLGASNKMNWFVGATAGMTHTSIKDADLSSGNNFVWGGQTGFMYNINDNWSTEIGYQYLKQDYEKDVGNGANTGTFSLNDTQQVYLAIDYKF